MPEEVRRYAALCRALELPQGEATNGLSDQTVELDGSRSRGRDLSYEWTFTDGSTAEGATVERTYRESDS